MEVKECQKQIGTKLLSVINRLSCQNEENYKLSQGAGSKTKGEKLCSLRENMEEQKATAKRINSKYHSKYPEKSVLKFKENDYEEFTNLNGDPHMSRLIPANVQFTLKPGIPNGTRPSMCFCKPPAKRQSNHETTNPRNSSQSHSAISSKEIFPNGSVVQQDYSQFYLDLLSKESSRGSVIKFGANLSRNEPDIDTGRQLVDNLVLLGDKQVDQKDECTEQKNYKDLSAKQIRNAQIDDDKQFCEQQISDGHNSSKQRESNEAQQVTYETGIVEVNKRNASNIEELSLKKDLPEKHTAKYSSVCGVCLQEFPSVLSLEKHQNEKGHYLCGECGEVLNDDATFREHLDKKLCKKAICIFCDQRFVTRDELEDHKSKVHHKCLECNKLYNSAEKLLAHNERHHGAPYTCLQCGQIFPTYSLCKKHTLNRHKKKKFYCPECGQGFTRINILHRHATYTHSNEKKFQCEICSKTFKRPDALKIHIITHSEKKPFRCEECGKQFTQKICYTKHIPCKQQNKISKKKNNAVQTMVKIPDKLSVEPRTLKHDLNNFSEIRENTASEILNTSKQENAITGKKTNETDLIDGEESYMYMGCRCPPSCRCKQFSIGLEVQTEKPKASILDSAQEIATLSCCCDIELQDVTISE